MNRVLAIALDLLREALRRKWMLALLGVITLVLGVLSFALELEVVDGALAASRFFGRDHDTGFKSAEVALRPIFRAASYVIFYGGIPFLILGCAEFASSLLSPGRIEHLLALPVRRWELLLGTYLGVVTLAIASALYFAGGLTLLLAVKTGIWTARPLFAAALCTLGFATVYSVMLASTVWVRSTALAAASGALVFVSGILAGNRATLAVMFEEGIGRKLFELYTLPFPRMTLLATAAADVGAAKSLESQAFLTMVAGFLLFALGALALANWRFERTDY